ncbi:putative quinol monooxygenase [Salinibacterium sp. TMP30]|uniref:putative quinol monooxygenase n=1 Tax=Salinibacterium sp. TMP30 TaxID=3138237 RepID=UPI003138CBE5
MSQPVIVTAVFHFRPESRDVVLAALRPAIAGVHDERGCELYAIHEAADGSLVMIEKWGSVELLDAHGSSPAVAALVAEIGEHLTAPVDVTRLTAIPMGTPAKGTL